MNENEGLKLYGQWNVQVYPAGTVSLGESVTVQLDNGIFMGRPIETQIEPVFESYGDNLITATGMALVCDMLIDTATFDTGLTYHAIGTATTAVASGNTQLAAEFNRKAVTSKSRNRNVITYSTFYTGAQSNASIEEAGMFGHSTASTASNTGILFSRYLVVLANVSATYDCTFNYTLQVGS